MDYFSQDYRNLVGRPETRDEQVGPSQRLMRVWDRRGPVLDMAWRIPAAGAAVLGTIAAGAVNPSVVPHGVHGAWEILTGGDYWD